MPQAQVSPLPRSHTRILRRCGPAYFYEFSVDPVGKERIVLAEGADRREIKIVYLRAEDYTVGIAHGYAADGPGAVRPAPLSGQ